MKKIIALLLSVTMLTVPVFAAVDLASMSNDDLLQLKIDLNAELANRNSLDVVPRGTYVVGVDMRADKFTFTGIGEDIYYIGWYANQDAADNGEIGDTFGMKTGREAYINLTDGMVFYCQADVGIELASASWQP